MLRGNFLKRSLDALKAQSHNVKLDPEHYSAVLPMMTFPDADSILRNCAIGSDSDTGGYSTANLEHVVEDGIPCLRFSGNLSLHVPPEARKRGMTHSGWAGWRTRPIPATLFNRHPMWDTSLFRFLSLRVKGDERRYYINVQTDSLDPIELWQHRLFLRTPGSWETILIPWGDFLRTRNGRISYKKFDGMDRERVKTIGASLIERKEGPFCLHIAEIKSVNTVGFQGPMVRYTAEEGQKFLDEERKRDEDDTAAYFAWKRGETPLGQEFEYHPPEPGNPSDSPSPSPGTAEPGVETEAPMKHLFDDPLFEEQGELYNAEKVDIDEIDVDDQSPEGRERRMRAMADELAGFSAGQHRQALQREEDRAREGLREGREIRDKFGQRFEEIPPSRRR